MKIFTRTACLGGWVTEAKFGDQNKHRYYNQQKVRADLFLDFVSGKTKIPPVKEEVLRHLNYDYYYGIYSQTEQLNWINSKIVPELIIMDNFSELVDKRFESRDGWGLCGVYGDFKEGFWKNVEDKGLLEDVCLAYDAFFNYIKNRWNIPIIFIHFPTTFDPREQYVEQGEKITEAMNKLAPKYNIQNIHADHSEIEKRDANYYHFTDKTVKNIVSKIKK